MALQSSGTISFENIKDEFGLPTNKNIGYYRQTFSGNTKYGELSFSGISPGVPSSGPIAFSDFYGKRLNIVVNYFSGSNEQKPQTARARYLAGSNAEGYVANKVTVVGELKNRPADTSGSKVIIHVNKRIGSNKASETSCALRTGDAWEAGTELQIDVGNEGQIMGAGGNGGNGSEGSGGGFNGGKGTSGLGIQFGTSSNKVAVNIQSSALITGGYGGGGGGGGAHDHDKNSERTANGGGGGGGAGFPAGSGGAAGESGSEGGNGGNGSAFGGGAGGGGGNNAGEAVAGGGGSGGGPGSEAGGATAEAGGNGSGGEGSGGSGGNFGANGEGILVTGAANTVTINETNEVSLGISYSTTVT